MVVQPHIQGIRRWFNLETKDLSKAIERKQELLDSPSLARDDALEVDCARFVNWKLARREYTSGSAEKARHVLKDFSSRFGASATLQTIRTSDIQKWYDGLLSPASKSPPLKATSWSSGHCSDGRSRSRDAVCAHRPQTFELSFPAASVVAIGRKRRELRASWKLPQTIICFSSCSAAPMRVSGEMRSWKRG